MQRQKRNRLEKTAVLRRCSVRRRRAPDDRDGLRTTVSYTGIKSSSIIISSVGGSDGGTGSSSNNS